MSTSTSSSVLFFTKNDEVASVDVHLVALYSTLGLLIIVIVGLITYIIMHRAGGVGSRDPETAEIGDFVTESLPMQDLLTPTPPPPPLPVKKEEKEV